MPRGRDRAGKRIYESVTFRELDDDSNLLADGLAAMGVRPGMRLVLMVPPSIDFISLVFAMFKSGVVTVLIDPGMGRRNLIRCLAESRPEGFIDRKSTRLNSSHVAISYAVFCLKKKKKKRQKRKL